MSHILSLPKLTVLTITGADRAAVADNVCTADLAKLAAGRWAEGFFTNVKGRVVGHGLFLAMPDRLVFVGEAGQGVALAEHLKRYIINEDADIADLSDRRRGWLLFGPDAEKHWAVVSGVATAESLASLDLDAHAMGKIAEQPVLIARAPWAPGGGWLVIGEEVGSDAVASGFAASGVASLGPDTWPSVRLSAGWPAYGVDITHANLPQEVNRNARAISFTKGCYLGQETVARLNALGHVNRLLVRLSSDDPEPLPAGAELFLPADADEARASPVGQITSSAREFGGAGGLSFAYVRAAHAAAGNALVCGGSRLVIHAQGVFGKRGVPF